MTTIKFKKLNIEAYKPGKSSTGRFKKIIKLSANESALGVSTKVKKIISKKNLNLFRYPDSKSKELRNQIAKKFLCDIVFFFTYLFYLILTLQLSHFLVFYLIFL